MLLPIVVVLISTAVVCADVPVVSASHDIQAVSLVHRHGDIAQPRWVQSAQGVGQVIPDSNPRDLLNAALGITLTPPAIDSSMPTEPEAKPTVLPADMSSVTMFLMGISSLGAWQFVRSAKNTKFHLGHMPEWYHTGGPIQVGGVAAFDFDYYTPTFCTLDEPAGKQQFSHHSGRNLPARLKGQFLLTVEAPRGPPRLCS